MTELKLISLNIKGLRNFMHIIHLIKTHKPDHKKPTSITLEHYCTREDSGQPLVTSGNQNRYLRHRSPSSHAASLYLSVSFTLVSLSPSLSLSLSLSPLSLSRSLSLSPQITRTYTSVNSFFPSSFSTILLLITFDVFSESPSLISLFLTIHVFAL